MGGRSENKCEVHVLGCVTPPVASTDRKWHHRRTARVVVVVFARWYVTRRASARDRDGFCLCGNEWRSEQLARCRLRFVGAMQAHVQSCDACKLSPMHVTPPITLSSFFETLTKMGPKMKDIESYCLEIFFLIPSPIQRRLHYNTASPYVVVIAAYSTCHV